MRICICHLIALLASALFVHAQTCYYPSGKPTDALKPCDATATVTHCCKDSDICLTNGLCFSPGLNSVLRRGCTDKTWNSTECPDICLTNGFQAADAVLTPCGGYGVFCCGQDNNARNCCNSTDSNRTVQLGTGSAMSNKTSTGPTTTITVSAGAGTSAAEGSKATPQGTCTQPKSIIIPLGVLLGCAILALAVLGTDWWHKKTQLKRPGRANILMN